jgi:hypothetical protein
MPSGGRGLQSTLQQKGVRSRIPETRNYSNPQLFAPNNLLRNPLKNVARLTFEYSMRRSITEPGNNGQQVHGVSAFLAIGWGKWIRIRKICIEGHDVC